MEPLMRQHRFLIVLMLLPLLVACSAQGAANQARALSYRGLRALSVSEDDTVAFVNDELGVQYLLHEATTQLFWTPDVGSKVQQEYDLLMPKNSWRLELDWTYGGRMVYSTWRYGDNVALVAYLDNLTSTQLNDLNRLYGISDAKSGSTLVITRVWDPTKFTTAPLPGWTKHEDPNLGISFYHPQAWMVEEFESDDGVTLYFSDESETNEFSIQLSSYQLIEDETGLIAEDFSSSEQLAFALFRYGYDVDSTLLSTITTMAAVGAQGSEYDHEYQQGGMLTLIPLDHGVILTRSAVDGSETTWDQALQIHQSVISTIDVLD